MEDKDGVVRERSAQVLGIMARKSELERERERERDQLCTFFIEHSLGRQAFLDLDMITALSKLVRKSTFLNRKYLLFVFWCTIIEWPVLRQRV